MSAGRWIRGTGWRSGEWQPLVEPTKEALDAVTGDRPAALMARDGHSLWLNSAALAHADGDLAVPGGVVETDALGEPTGVLREESAWEFRRRFVFERIGEDERLEAMRAGIRLAASRGVTSVHDKDGWLGDSPPFSAAEGRGSALAARVAVAAARAPDRARVARTSAPGSATAGCAPDT